MKRFCMSIVLVAAVALLPARPAHAQSTPLGDVAVSYSFLRFVEGDGLNLSAGWLVSVSRRIGPVFSVVGEAAGNYRSDEGDWLMVHSFMGGVRASPRSRAGVRPFAQLLVGAAAASCCGESDTKPAVEPGGGLDVPIGERTAARIGVSFPFVFDEGDVTKLFRFQAGVVFRIGGR